MRVYTEKVVMFWVLKVVINQLAPQRHNLQTTLAFDGNAVS
jgi:hypothetical protein